MTAFFVVFQVNATLQLHRHSFESFGLGPLFPDNPNCGLFLVFLLGSMSSLKRFASYLFRHSQTEISPICHVMTCVHQEKGILLLTPFYSFLCFFFPFLAFESCKRQSKSQQHPPFTSLLLLPTPFKR